MIERRTFPGTTAAVPEARRYVVSRLAAISRERREEIALMVSELATNAVHHARTDFTVTLQHDDREVRVEITDGGTGRPTVKSPEPMEPSGRGLRIVSDLADSFGIRPGPEAGGSTVWFVVRDRDTGTRGGLEEAEPTVKRSGEPPTVGTSREAARRRTSQSRGRRSQPGGESPSAHGRSRHPRRRTRPRATFGPPRSRRG